MGDATSDNADWALLGEAVVAFAWGGRRRLGPLPPGVHRLPGPVIVLAERFVDSPVGEFVSFSIGEPAVVGTKPGVHFSVCAVNNDDARRLMRTLWGMPAELGALRWSSDAGVRVMSWDERGILIEADAGRRPMPFTIPFRMLQRRADGPVTVASHMRALVRRSTVQLTIDTDDPLTFLAGPRSGVTLANMVVRRMRAKAKGSRPGVRSAVPATKPGVVGMKDGPVMAEGVFSRRIRWRSPSGV